MKKQLLLGAALLSSVFISNAQEVLLSNNFGTDNPSLQAATEGWIAAELDDDEDSWSYFLDPNIQAIGFTGIQAGSASFLVEGEEPNTTLVPTSPKNIYVSPMIDLTAYEGGAELTYKIGSFGQAESVMAYKILVITEAQAQDENFDLEAVEPEMSGTINAGVAQDEEIDLASFGGEQMRVIFMHTDDSVGIGYLLIDDIVVTSQGVASVNDVLASQFSIYPNPATDVINISNADNIHVNSVAVVDFNGRTVKTLSYDGVTEAAINISDLSAGMYLLNVSSDKGTMTKKIVKN